MRYLLEALEADRERFPDLQNVYAFASTTKNDEAETVALWEAKGIIAVPYTLADGRHDSLYGTLSEWKNYAEDPTAWRRSRLQTIFAVSPSEQTDELIAESISLLGHADATQLLGDLSPNSEWFAILRERRLFLSGKVTPSLWLASRIRDPKIIGEAAALPSLDDETRWHVDRALELEEAQLNPLFRRAWELLLSAKRPQADSYDDNWYTGTRRIKQGDTGYQIRALITQLLRPRLKVAKPVRFRHEDVEAVPTSLLDLIWIDFEASEGTPVTEVLAAWPQELEAEKALFRQLERIYLDVLEEAEDVGFISMWDRADSDVPSIAPHPQNAHRSGFYPIVRALADLWQRIATRDPACGRELSTAFVSQRFHLTRRLQLFSLSHKIFSAEEIGAFLLKVDDDLFWSETAQVEVMRLLTTRWSTLGRATCSAIEARLCKGVPRDRYSPDAFENEEEWESIRDYSVYRRLTRLQATGALLEPETLEKLQVIQTKHPRWKPSPGDRDDFYAWHESSGGTAGDPTLLAGVSDEALVQEAMRIQREQRFEQGDVWWAFCSADPNRALRGLQADEKSGRWDVTAWSTLLRAASHVEDAEIALDIAASLLGMSHNHLKHLSTAAVSWLQFRRAILESGRAEGSNLFLQLWDCLANIAFRPPPESIEENSVGASEGIGSVLALTALESLVSTKPAHRSGIGSIWVGRFDLMLGAGNRAGLSAVTYLVRQMVRLDWIDPHGPQKNWCLSFPGIIRTDRPCFAPTRGLGWDRRSSSTR
jgi:hypothetical protein